MRIRKDIDPAYYETHSLLPDLLEGERNGTLMVSRPGESVFDVIKRREAADTKTTVSMRMRVGVLNEVKEQAAVAGVPWTSYVRAIVEQAVAAARVAPGQTPAAALR